MSVEATVDTHLLMDDGTNDTHAKITVFGTAEQVLADLKKFGFFIEEENK